MKYILIGLVTAFIMLCVVVVRINSELFQSDVYFTLKDVNSGLIVTDTIAVNTIEYDLLTGNVEALEVVDGEIGVAKKIGNYKIVSVRNSERREFLISMQDSYGNLIIVCSVLIVIFVFIFLKS